MAPAMARERERLPPHAAVRRRGKQKGTLTRSDGEGTEGERKEVGGGACVPVE